MALINLFSVQTKCNLMKNTTTNQTGFWWKVTDHGAFKH